MILDKTWNKKERKLTISYINKAGKREFYTKYLAYIKTYEYDDDGPIETWNGRRCKEVYKDTSEYVPNNFDLLTYLYELPSDLLEKLHAQNFPKLYTFDIETEFIPGVFPNPDKAEHKVTAISLVGPDMSCIVYGLNKMNDNSIALFRKRYLEWIDNNEFAKDIMIKNNLHPKVLYQYFETEEDMLIHFFTKIIPRISVLAGWNSWAFDLKYLVNRLINLFGKGKAFYYIKKSSPVGEIKQYSWLMQNGLHDHCPGPVHSEILDYMEIVKKYDYSLRPYESYSLDWVASKAVNAHKIKYSHDLQYLYEHDHEWYYYYNAIDSLLVLLIHYKLKSLESPAAVSSVTLCSLSESFGQIALTTANVYHEFYNEGKRVVWDWDAIDRTKRDYKGAFTGCVPGKYEFNACFDFKSLYPSQIQTCNLSMENFMQKYSEPDSLGRIIPIPWTDDELNEFRKNPKYFVTVMNHVYKNDKDYCFKIVQASILGLRDKYKYTGQKIESQLISEIDRLIAEKK